MQTWGTSALLPLHEQLDLCPVESKALLFRDRPPHSVETYCSELRITFGPSERLNSFTTAQQQRYRLAVARKSMQVAKHSPVSYRDYANCSRINFTVGCLLGSKLVFVPTKFVFLTVIWIIRIMTWVSLDPTNNTLLGNPTCKSFIIAVFSNFLLFIFLSTFSIVLPKTLLGNLTFIK